MTPIDLPAYRAELQAALSVLGPQIDGLDDLSRATLSPLALQVISTQLTSHKTRLQLIKGVIADIDALLLAIAALTNNGYPSTPTVFVPEAILDEIAKESSSIGAAISIFSAGGIVLDIAAAVFTSHPIPVA